MPGPVGNHSKDQVEQRETKENLDRMIKFLLNSYDYACRNYMYIIIIIYIYIYILYVIYEDTCLKMYNNKIIHASKLP